MFGRQRTSRMLSLLIAFATAGMVALAPLGPGAVAWAASVPDEPVIYSVVAGGDWLRVTWGEGAGEGPAITHNDVWAYDQQTGIQSTCSTNGSSEPTVCTLFGLTPNTGYYVAVQGFNSVGGSTVARTTATTARVNSTISVDDPTDTVYGRSFSIWVTVMSPEVPNIPDYYGTVDFWYGSQFLGSAGVGTTECDASGSDTACKALATIDVSGYVLPAGRRAITASYEGDPTRGASDSAPLAVWVAKAPTASTAKLSTRLVSHRRHARVTVTVRAAGVTPTGAIGIYKGSRRIAYVLLRGSAAGRVVITLPKLRVGYYKLRARYYGNKNLAASRSRLMYLRSR